MIGAPVLTTVVSYDMAHSFEVMSVLAQVNAALIIAVVIDGRDAFNLVGHGGSRPQKTTLRLAFLMLIAIGTIAVVNGAIVAKTTPPTGVSFDLALMLSLGYGLMSCIGAVVLLTLNAGARLLGIGSELDEDVADQGSEADR